MRQTMAKQMTCRDAGMDYPGQFKAETEDELMEHIQVHAWRAHPEIKITPELETQVKGLIKTVA
jgi:predicted small metal-binding protein